MLCKFATWMQAARLAVRCRRNGWKVRVKLVKGKWTTFACPPHYFFS